MIEELRRFILVAENGNVSKTAESIFITQSALSQSIKRLEKEFGTKLFVQKGKRLHITSDGKAVMEIGKKILDLWEKAKTPAIRNTGKPTYSIGLFDSAAMRLGKYFTENAKSSLFNLELSISGSANLLSNLQLGTLDIAICVLDAHNPQPKDLLLVKTFTEKLIPVTAKISNGAAADIPFIVYTTGSHTRSQIDDTFSKQGIVPNVFAQSTSVSFMKELALLGSGVALLPENHIATELKQKTLKKQKLPLPFERQCGVYIQKNGSIQTDHVLIKDILKIL